MKLFVAGKAYLQICPEGVIFDPKIDACTTPDQSARPGGEYSKNDLTLVTTLRERHKEFLQGGGAIFICFQGRAKTPKKT